MSALARRRARGVASGRREPAWRVQRQAGRDAGEAVAARRLRGRKGRADALGQPPQPGRAAGEIQRVDLSRAQWDELIPVLRERRLIPYLDLAYQGFGDGIEADAYAARALASAGISFFIANSFSKSMSVYGERCGALSVVCPDAAQAVNVLGQLKFTVRRNYSSPPIHGGQLVATVLDEPDLRALWERDLEAMRVRILAMRKALHAVLSAKVPGRDFGYILRQRGMFSYTGLSPEQVDRLREEHAVYMVRSGRICVAGLNSHNVEATAVAMAAVMAG